jgi:hemolysin III
MPSEQHNEYSVGEEIANSITHGLGVGLAIAALAVLVTLAVLHGDAWRVVGFSIYGATLIALYLASTLYHASPWPRVKHLFRIFDYSAVYLLIAGTYTPFCLVTLRGGWGWSIFGVIWGLAIVGIAVTPVWLLKRHQKTPLWFTWLPAGIYVGMGWIIIVALKPLLDALPGAGLAWLFAGGVTYTLGVLVWMFDQMPFNHAVWHLFVLGGSLCHFLGILWYVLPMTRP